MIRQNATEESPVSWLYNNQLIEILYFDKQFHIRCRPPGLNMETILWPVPKYQDKERCEKAINRLLNKLCEAINRNEYLVPRVKPFTHDKRFLAYLQSLGNRYCGGHIKAFELTGIIENGKKQLELILF